MIPKHIPKVDPQVRADFLNAEEGKIFAVGCCMLIVWVEAMALFWSLGHPMWLNMLTVGLAHVVAGRAASIAHGTQVGLSPWLTCLLATYADTMAMFVIYPMLVYGYQHFVENVFFQKHMKPIFESAQRRMPRVRRFKIAGVFLFVFFPFWMTGVIVGAVLGYLLGLKTWVNMTTVVLGSATAVLTWVYAYDRAFGWLTDVHPSVPLVLTALIFAALIASRLAKRSASKRKKKA